MNLDRTSSARAKPTSEGVVFHHADDKFLIAAEADTNSARHPFRGDVTHPPFPAPLRRVGVKNFSEQGRGGSDELGEGHGLPSSLGPTDDSRSQGAWDGCETRGWSSRARSSRVPSLRAFSLVEGSGGGARPGVDATRVSAGSRSAVELVEACFEAPYGAVDIGELVEAEESDAE